MKKQYDTILFDLDGTLLDNDASFARAFRVMKMLYPETFSQNVAFDLAGMIDLYKHHKPNPEGYLSEYCQKTGWVLERRPEAFVSFWFGLYLDYPVLYPEALPLLRYLKEKNYKLGIVTNGNTLTQSRKLRSCGVDDLVEVSIISDSVGVAKPSPGIYYIALERLQAKAENALFVGNNPDTDILGAINAGVDSFFIPGRTLTQTPTYIGELKELFQLL
ncbi:MAG: HAD family hydrolase [Clostridia bacterium]|nr:HAD family hydrolase [Clostridia bacterium]